MGNDRADMSALDDHLHPSQRDQDEMGSYEEDYDGEEDEEEDGTESEEGEDVEDVPNWSALTNHPATTQRALFALLQTLRQQNRSSVRILIIGKNGVGKSSTINSVLAENAVTTARPYAMAPATRCTPVSRQAGGFTLHFVDTPGLLEGDSVSSVAVGAIGAEMRRAKGVDAVVFLDRFDSYRVEDTDRMLMQQLTAAFGPEIWQHTVLGLTHCQMRNPPPGHTYEEFRDKRVAMLQDTITAAAGRGSEPVPVVFIENSSRCETDAETGEKVVNGQPWLSPLMEAVVSLTLDGPFRVSPQARNRANPNRRRLWLIPFMLAAQVVMKKLVFDRVVEIDGCKGDVNGPYDEDTVDEELARLRERKEDEKERREEARKREQRRRDADRLRAEARASRIDDNSWDLVDDDEDDDLDDE